MDLPVPYIPQDRHRALAAGVDLPEFPRGAALFADISGFTPLTEALTREFGSRRGVDLLCQQINAVYEALIAVVETVDGSVITFAGDAITCWFDDGDTAGSGARRAAACAHGMQAAMAGLGSAGQPAGGALTLKVGCASGVARRFSVGDPQFALFDVLAGATLDRMAAAERLARAGEVVVDTATWAALGRPEVAEWRDDAGSGERMAVLAAPDAPAIPPAAPPAAAAWPGAEATLRAWLSPEIYPRAAQGDVFLELRPVVAGFIRLRALDYDRDPQAPERLDRYIRWVQAVLARFGGTLLELIVGDKGCYLYATWGAPVMHEDDGPRAAHAALELSQTPRELAFMGDVHIGMSRGVMRVGAFGSRSRRTYGVLGDEVNVAARLMQAAGPGQILISGRVRTACVGQMICEELPPAVLKGKREPVAVYRLIAAGHMAAPEPQLPPAQALVGRQAELAALTALLNRARGGAGHAVSLAGEAGLGKSRLAAELGRVAQRAGWAVFVGAAPSFGTTSSYLAWRPIWLAFLGVEPELSPALRLAQAEAGLRRWAPAAAERLPLLGPILDLAIPETPLTASMDEKLRKESREALLVEMVRRRSRAEPLLLILEDIHWLDPLSRDLLLALARAIRTAPVLVLATGRPVEVEQDRLLADLAGAQATLINLGSLPPPDAAALLAARLELARPGARLSAALMDRLVDWAQGNPFYLEELLLYLLEQSGSGEELAIPAQIALPDSIHSLILTRIDQLRERTQLTLKVASVLGRMVRVAWLDGYRSLLSGTVNIQGDLDEIARRNLLLLDSPEPELVYLFRHLITHEVIYTSLTERVRQQLHGQLAGWLELAGSADLDLLAYHYGRSANTPKRREYLRRAGDAALSLWAVGAAIDYYERLLAELPADDPERGAVCYDLAEAFHRAGAWDSAAERFAAAHAAARSPAAQARAALGLGMLDGKRGRYDSAGAWLEQALADYRAAADQAGVAQSLVELGRLFWVQGRYDRAQELLENGWWAAETIDDQLTMARVRFTLGIIAVRQGDGAAAQKRLQESLESYQALGNREGVASVLNSLGIVALEHGDMAEARSRLEQSLALRRELGARWGMALTLGNLGLVAQTAGDWAVAERMHAESLALFQDLGDRVGMANTLQNLSFAVLDQQRPEEAQRHLIACLQLCRSLGSGPPTPAALLGAAAILAPEPAAARVLGACVAILAAQGSAFEALEQRFFDTTTTTLRQALGAAGYAELFAAGQALGWEAAIDLALSALAAPVGSS
jgi:adenylate cyclase